MLWCHGKLLDILSVQALTKKCKKLGWLGLMASELGLTIAGVQTLAVQDNVSFFNVQPRSNGL